MLGFLGSDWICPRLTKAKTSGDFLRSELRGRFDDGSQRVPVDPRVFSVGVVDAPKLIPGWGVRIRIAFMPPVNTMLRASLVPDRHNLAARNAV